MEVLLSDTIRIESFSHLCRIRHLRLRSAIGLRYVSMMCKMVSIVVAIISLLISPVAVIANSGVIVLPEAVRSTEGVTAIAVESADKTIVSRASRALGLHGAYKVVEANQAAFTFQIERASESSVVLSILSGKPAQTLLRETISGGNLHNAVLRACDRAVERTLGIPGFFSGKLAFVGKQRGITEIYTSDVLFSSVRALTRDRALVTGPSWSPDGSRLLYTTYYKTGFPDIYLIDLYKGIKTPVANFKGTNTGGEFSPDGQRIAMSLSGAGNSEIYVANQAGRNLRRLTTNRSLETSPSWSPDGRRLVYTSDALGKPQLYEIAASGGPARRLPTNVSSYCSEPAWNPVHTNLIAFTAAVRGGFQIALYDAKTRSARILTSVADSAVEPSWTNDGRHLVFTRREGAQTRLMLLDTTTGKVSSLHSTSVGQASSPSFVY